MLLAHMSLDERKRPISALLRSLYGRSLVTLVNLPDLAGETPLRRAVRTGSSSSVRLLMRHGATVRSRHRHRESLLALACRLGHLSCARALLEADECPTEENVEALWAAVGAGHEDCAALLLDWGVSPDALPRPNSNPNPNPSDPTQPSSALALACVRGRVGCARLLVERGATTDTELLHSPCLRDLPDLLSPLK